MASPSTHKNERWQRTSDFLWTEQAYDRLEKGLLRASVNNSDGVLSTQVWGSCPRCDGTFDDRQVHTAVTNLMPGPVRSDTDSEEESVIVVDVTCSCTEEHPGAPENATGCGASFRVELVVEADTR